MAIANKNSFITTILIQLFGPLFSLPNKYETLTCFNENVFQKWFCIAWPREGGKEKGHSGIGKVVHICAKNIVNKIRLYWVVSLFFKRMPVIFSAQKTPGTLGVTICAVFTGKNKRVVATSALPPMLTINNECKAKKQIYRFFRNIQPCFFKTNEAHSVQGCKEGRAKLQFVRVCEQVLKRFASTSPS